MENSTPNNRLCILNEILGERDRQFHLPGNEYDQLHSINDWIAISSRYLSECSTRKHTASSIDDARSSFIKAAAVILAAIEHLDIKKNKGA